eukprot:gene38323-47314_t
MSSVNFSVQALQGSGPFPTVKIADFGLSALVRMDERWGDQRWGTQEYFAPEVVTQNYGPQADVWAL